MFLLIALSVKILVYLVSIEDRALGVRAVLSSVTGIFFPLIISPRGFSVVNDHTCTANLLVYFGLLSLSIFLRTGCPFDESLAL